MAGLFWMNWRSPATKALPKAFAYERRHAARIATAAASEKRRGGLIAIPRPRASVPVVLRLERPLDRHAEVTGLLLGERRQLHPELAEVKARHLLVELLRQDVHAERELLGPERDLGEHLV